MSITFKLYNLVGYHILLTLVLIFLALKAGGQVQPPKIVPVAQSELSGSSIRCIHKDSRGFIWMGTGTGLIRYDGTSVHRYERAGSSESAITDNRINAIIEDRKNNLWIGTAQGLMIYNPETDRFRDVDSIPQNTNHLTTRYISALSMDAEGRIWIGTLGQGLNVYDPKTFTFTYLVEETVDNKNPPVNYITSIYYDGKIIWAGTKGGLKLVDTETLASIPLPVKDPSLAFKEIMQVTPDPSGSMWLATSDRELIKLTRVDGSYTISKTSIGRTTPEEAESNIVTLAVGSDGTLWFSGENLGLNSLNVKTNAITHLKAEQGNPKKLPTNSIRTIYVDNTGIIWIGTYSRGVYMIDNLAKKFYSFQRSDFNPVGIEGNNVQGIAEDKEGTIWLACDGGGLARFYPQTAQLDFDKDLTKRLGTKYLSALLMDDADNLWVGSWGRGVFKVNLKTRTVENYKTVSNGFGDNKIFSLYQDSRNMIWAGSAGSGLFYFDVAAKRFRPLHENKKPNFVPTSAYVSSILEDSNGSLWVGTLFGLYRLQYIDKDEYKVELYEKNNEPETIGSYDIQSIFEDADQNLWISTGDNGVAMLERDSKKFRHIQKQDGLSTNSIRGILADSNKNLWISTNSGLSRYDASTKVFRHFTIKDGLPSNQFNPNVYLRATDGKFYFGADGGLLAFHPDSIRQNVHQPKVYLTDLKLNNQSVVIGDEDSPLQKHISLSEAIDLSYSQRSFAIDFVALSYGESSGNSYCYKLEGFDDDWNCVGSETRATYTNIDAGNYVFLVKASNSDGVNSQIPARLEINIDPAPWNTWWAFVIYMAVLSTAIFTLVKIRDAQAKIRHQLDLERLAREQEHTLSESKTQFFTNISHEFRTPLSLISMPLESLISMSDLPNTAKERLRTIRTSADKMMRLVNELMDFNKLEGSKLKLRVQHGELVSFTKNIASVFHDLAKRRHIHFGVHEMVRSLEGWFDHDKLEKILFNVLSNAFKFTLDNGQINITINIRQGRPGEATNTRFLELVILDNGIGISAEELPFIFDKFYQAKSSMNSANPGTGIGLALTKGLVELHHGTIEVESTPSAETKFIILLPIDKHVFNDDDICEASGYVAVSPGGIITENSVQPAADGLQEEYDRSPILLVEDNDELREYLAMELRHHFTVLEAKDGVEGLQLATEKSPDLIISDILMPHKSGLELCSEIKSNIKTSHIPFILLTAKAMVDDQIAGVEAGADVYITKPFHIRFLLTQVNQIIESRQKLYARFSHDVYLMPGKIASNEIDQAFLQKAIDYVVENMQDHQLGVDAMADVFNLSRMQLYRKIKALTGKSVVEFIRMVRVKQALKLMETHKFTLSEIAYQTGFNSASYFTRVFKEEFGKTPSEYLEHA